MTSCYCGAECLNNSRIVFSRTKLYLWLRAAKNILLSGNIENGENCLPDESIVSNSLYTIYNKCAALSVEKVSVEVSGDDEK